MSPAMNYSCLAEILFPIQQTLNRSLSKSNGPNKTTIKACTTLCEILDTVNIDSMDFDSFADLYVALSWLADDRVSEKNESPTSREDLKAACIEACYSLIKYVPLCVLMQALSNATFIKALGHSISVFLSTALREQSKSLKISSLKALEVLLIRSHTLSEVGKMTPQSLSSVYTPFLPGASLTVSKIISSDDKHPRGLLVVSLSVLSLTLTITQPKEVECEVNESDSKTLNNLRAVIEKIIPNVISHRSNDVKLALLSFVKSIYEKGSQELLDTLNVTLLEVPLRFSMDSEDKSLQNNAMTFLCDITKTHESVYNIVKEKAISILLNAADTVNTSNIQLLAAIFTLMSKSTGFNDFLCTPSHRNRLMYFLSVYTELLPVNPSDTTFDGDVKFKHISSGQIEQLTSVIGTSASVNILMDFIVDYLHCTNFSSNCVFACNLMVQSSLASHDQLTQCNKLSLFYLEICMQLLEEETLSHDKSATPLTAAPSSTNSLKLMSVDSLPCTSSSFKNELSSKSFYKIYFALQGLLCCTGESASETVYHEKSRLHLNPLDNKGKKGEMAQFILTLLRVQSVSLTSQCTKVLMKSAQNVLHTFSVITLLEEASDDIAHSSSTASAKLIDKYLVGIIMLVDSEISINPYDDASSLLYVLCSYCKWRHVPLYKCLVDRLVEILDANYTQDANNLLKALLVIAKWMKQAKQDESKGARENVHGKCERVIHQHSKCGEDNAGCTTDIAACASSSESTFTRCRKMDIKCTDTTASHQMYPEKLDSDEDDLLVIWKNFLRYWYESESFQDSHEEDDAQGINCPWKASEEDERKKCHEKDEEEREEGNKFDEDVAKKPPASLMTKEILARCVNLLATPDPMTRIVNLEVIEITCIILHMMEEENLLLPLVDRAWRQLVIRLTDEASVARVALRVLLTLTSVCGDFIRDRTVTDVIPKIISYLKAHVNDSCRKESKLGHRFTTVFHYQLEALNSLGKLVCNLPILGKNLWPIIAITIEYCRKDQLNDLRDAATNSMKLYRSIDRDAVYFYTNCTTLHT